MNENYCNNCGKYGHYYHHCKMPITSIGIIVFRVNKTNKIEYLMIRRKDTLGYIDFMRGKYSIYNKEYIMNMLKQMTQDEKEVLKKKDFHLAWRRIWGNQHISNQYKSEECTSREKFLLLHNGIYYFRPNRKSEKSEKSEKMDIDADSMQRITNNVNSSSDFYTLNSMIEESNQYEIWNEAEWGFPKGRRNYQEMDFECALREFTEETGYDYKSLKNIQNLLPFEEIFTGSNYKSYKHKYYLAYMDYDQSENLTNVKSYQPEEVSKLEWKTYEKCINSIREYNLEKKRLISNVHNTLMQYYFTDAT